MKINIHKSENRGKGDHDWLKSSFSFSFADYYNEERMGFGKLRVLNDDIIAPGKGFSSHPHANMEIITIPLKGELAHKDSTGNEEVITPGQLQVMSAGSGIIHSEYNHSQTEPLELFQIWIQTKKEGINPRHDTKSFELKPNQLNLVVEGQDNKDTLLINQDATIHVGEFNENTEITYNPKKENGTFIMVTEGSVEINNKTAEKRDSIEITGAEEIKLNIKKNSEVIVIEVPM